MADFHFPQSSPSKRPNPFDKQLETDPTLNEQNDDFGLFQDSLTQSDENGIPVIVCGTADMAANRTSMQAEGGSIFNRLLRPLTPSEATRTQMEPTRPRLVLKDDQDDDDDDLLCPDTSQLLPRDSSESLVEEEERDAAPRDVADGLASGEGGGRRHCHQPLPLGREKTKAKIQLVVVSVLCFLFMLGEIAGGFIANSLALQTDAAHLASDLIAFLVSLFALWASGKPATKKMSFGFHRIEVLGALFSIVMIWLLTAFLVFMAVQRIVNRDYEIDADAMLVTAGCGVAFNIIMCAVLHADFCAPEMGTLIKHGHSHGGGHGHSHGGGHSHAGSTDDGDHTGRWSFGRNEPHVGDAVYHDLAEGGGSGSGSGDAHARIGSSRRPSQRLLRDQPPDLVDNLPHSYAPAVNGDEPSPVHDALPPPSSISPPAHSLHQVPAVSTVSKKMNINVRAAVIHVIGDLIQSIGVLIAAYIIKYKAEKDSRYLIADPICTFIFSILVLGSTVTVFRDVLTVLMEATPRDVDYNQLKFDLENIPGVKTAHSLHVWCLTLDKYAIAVHLGVSSPEKQAILEQASSMLQQKYQIHHTTIQVEDFAEEAMTSCSRCIGPQK